MSFKHTILNTNLIGFKLKKLIMKKFLVFLLSIYFLSYIIVDTTNACTRVVYKGFDNQIITARSMDWKEPMMTNLWILPKGMERNGEVGKSPMTWVSKYGSVIATAYDIASTDGMNEKGLVANLLWLAESSYPEWEGKVPVMSISIWVQYMLDNFATVSEAVAAFKNQDIAVVSDMMPDGTRMATLHLSISDATGDNAIFEYIDGKLNIHHGLEYQVMTNSPVYDQQLSLNEYWKNIGGTTFLPGTNRAADRFVRASFYINAIPKSEDPKVAIASVFSVIRNVSVPFGITTENEPNISSTRWRTVSDQKNLIYFYESALYPNVFWVDFNDIDLSENGSVKKLDLNVPHTYGGEVSKEFVTSKPFKFLGKDL